MSPLTRQSNKAKHIKSVVCLTNGIGHKHITACHSVSEPHLSYQQVIQPTGKQIIEGHKVIVYTVTCSQVQATGMEQCKGNGHTHTLCQHSLSGVRAVVKAQGKKLRTAKTLANALKSKGVLVKLVGESGYCFGVIS